MNRHNLISGSEVLEEGSPLGDQVRADNWPCSCLVAAWIQAIQGRQAENMGGWSDLFPPSWSAINILPGWQPFDGVRIVYTLVGYDLAIAHPGDPIPALAPRTWHVVQRWKECEGERETWSGGHCFLVYMGPDGLATVYHSDETSGYRVEVGTWIGDAGLGGYSVGVAYVKAPQ